MILHKDLVNLYNLIKIYVHINILIEIMDLLFRILIIKLINKYFLIEGIKLILVILSMLAMLNLCMINILIKKI